MRVLLAGTKSGAGKTSITCGIITVLKKLGYKVSALKCGPDYIDPMFHREVLQVPSGNLDCFMSDEQYCIDRISDKEVNSDILIIEGVMGYYDGIGFSSKAGSSDIARITSSPVILIVDAEGSARSVIATIKGFLDMDELGLIKGVIFNRMPEKVYNQAYDEVKKLGVIPCGFVKKDKLFSLESRHLGLKMPFENSETIDTLDYIAEKLENTLDFEKILDIARGSEKLQTTAEGLKHDIKIRIGVAYDEAFCFIYDDLWTAFDRIGLEPIIFSLIHDKCLPKDICGLYLCGGYPENYLQALSENSSMIECIRMSFKSKIPLIAECGGFMYLHESMEDSSGNEFCLVGVIEGKCKKTQSLQHFGYGMLEFEKDCVLGKRGDSFPIHSFHYYMSTSNYADCKITKASDGSSWNECMITDWFYGGFPHFFMQGNQALLNSFYDACKKWGKDMKINDR